MDARARASSWRVLTILVHLEPLGKSWVFSGCVGPDLIIGDQWENPDVRAVGGRWRRKLRCWYR
jgi:hypothetical protein